MPEITLLCSIDLTDPRVQKMLHDLQQEHLHKSTMPKAPLAHSGTQFETALLEADEILEKMTKEEISQLLVSEGIDLHSITDEYEMNVHEHSYIARLYVFCRK